MDSLQEIKEFGLFDLLVVGEHGQIRLGLDRSVGLHLLQQRLQQVDLIRNGGLKPTVVLLGTGGFPFYSIDHFDFLEDMDSYVPP